jgi:hypothetical protein
MQAHCNSAKNGHTCDGLVEWCKLLYECLTRNCVLGAHGAKVGIRQQNQRDPACFLLQK